jgi:hypothetical protein
MPAAQIEQLQKQYARKRLLEKYRIPRLSLFYMLTCFPDPGAPEGAIIPAALAARRIACPDTNPDTSSIRTIQAQR